MIWVDREVKKLAERKLPLEWVDDMKTPSGRIHVGSLRGVVIHDLLYKVLKENNIPAQFSYVFNDLDPMDAIPAYLDYDKWEQYAGMPLCDIPSPEPGAKTFSEFYAKEFQTVFESINCHPQIIRSSEWYRSGKLNDVVKEILDATPKIRELYLSISKAKKPDDWHPINAICERCKKIGTTYVYKWDGEFIYYECREEMVEWARGCGHKGKITPFNGNAKLVWRLDWPAHWKKIGVTIEGSGKDHMSSGGSYDFASAVCKEVINYSAPYAPAYEWFIIGGKKMSSSKGIGTSARDSSKILPPELLRFLLVRTPIGTALDFDPFGDTILNLFDDYDRCMNAYFDKLEGKISKDKQGEVTLDFARIAELSEVRPLPKERIYLPRFRTIVNTIKTKADLDTVFQKHKGSKLTKEEHEILQERVDYAKRYLKNYADKDEKIQFNKTVPAKLSLTDAQKSFLKELHTKLSGKNKATRDEIQQIVFDILKEKNFKPKEVFPGFYQLLINRDFGPKAADIILDYGVEKVIKLLEQSSNK